MKVITSIYRRWIGWTFLGAFTQGIVWVVACFSICPPIDESKVHPKLAGIPLSDLLVRVSGLGEIEITDGRSRNFFLPSFVGDTASSVRTGKYYIDTKQYPHTKRKLIRAIENETAPGRAERISILTNNPIALTRVHIIDYFDSSIHWIRNVARAFIFGESHNPVVPLTF